MSDALAFAQAADAEGRRDAWIATAYERTGRVLDDLDGIQFGTALDLSMALEYLEQLGADRDDTGGDRDA